MTTLAFYVEKQYYLLFDFFVGFYIFFMMYCILLLLAICPSTFTKHEYDMKELPPFFLVRDDCNADDICRA